MMETISASVSILGRTYKLRVAKEDEAALRKAAEAIETQAKQYGNMYAYNDHQDLLAMVALTQITQLTKIQDSLRFKDTDLAQRLQSIDSVLEEILHPTR
ncbi:MAG: cell division protein ZapA [Bacteroidales bacterium]|jgi:cell division protein ZapA (FtsZ GTPase activity inhibitor)|nr:cell division protein ZapA [Bacteroidales bacterium]